MEDFSAWADTALAPRLSCLSFACAVDRRIFVTGEPLPSVRGAAYYAAGRTYLPAGYVLPHNLWPELVEELLNLGRGKQAILHPDGSYEEISSDHLIPASRASVRMTALDAGPSPARLPA